MKVYSTPTHYILNPDCHEITPEMADFLGVAYRSMPRDKQVAFDLSIVKTCSNKFFMMFEKLSKQRQISIVNMNDKMLASLYLMKYDKFVKIYTTDIDLFDDRHELKNRRFSLVAV